MKHRANITDDITATVELVSLDFPETGPFQVFRFEVFDAGEHLESGSFHYGENYFTPADVVDQLRWEYTQDRYTEYACGDVSDADSGL